MLMLAVVFAHRLAQGDLLFVLLGLLLGIRGVLLWVLTSLNVLLAGRLANRSWAEAVSG